MTGCPASWPRKRLGLVARLRPRGVVGEALNDAEDVTFLPMDAIGEQGDLDVSSTRRVADVKSGYSRFSEGDVVIAKITPCFENGKGALIRGTKTGVGFGTTELHVVMPGPGLDGRFLYYVTAQPRFRRLGKGWMIGAAGQQRVPEEFVRDFPLRVPPITRQREIANYLDRETARIDQLIAAKQRLLGLTVEKRLAFVSRAVTCGLINNVPLRDAGIPWLRKIPAHWAVWKIGHFCKVGNGATPRRGDERFWTGGTIPWLNSGVVNQDEVVSSEQHVTHTAIRECHLPLLTPRTVLVAVTGQGKTRGRACVLSIEATINQHLAFINPDPARLHAWFLRWWLFAAYGFLRGISDDAGGTKGALTCEDLANLRIPLPPLSEQDAIVKHIARENTRLERARAVASRTISLLKERRQALIAATVAGEIDVEEDP